MFPRSIEIGKNIYLVPKFLSQAECDKLYSDVLSLPLSAWGEEDENNWAKDKLSASVTSLRFVQQKMAELFGPKYHLMDNIRFQRLRQGQDMYAHYDRPDDPGHIDDENCQCSLIEWGAIVYINDDYTGGEISYPDHYLSYKPKAGDLVIHKRDVLHEVKTVTSGTRYVYSNFAHRTIHALEQ